MTDTATEPTETPRFVVDSNEPAPTSEPIEQEVKTEPAELATDSQGNQEEPEHKKRDAQARIRELNARAKAAEERASELEAKLNSGKQPDQQRQESKIVKPNPADYVGGRFNDDYQTAYENYVESVAEEKAIRALTERQQADQLQTRVSQIQQAEQAFVATHTDYHDVLQDVIESGMLNDRAVYDAIIDLPNSPEIVYRIGNDPDLLAELSAMPANQRLLKIGAIAYGQPATQQSESTKAKISNAPKPISPVSGGTAVLSVAEQLEAAEKSGDYDAWKAAKRSARK